MTTIETTTQTKKAKKSKAPAESRTWTESLDVKMTEKELAELAPRIDSAIAEVEALDEQRKATNDGFKARIELAEAHVRELRAFAASGKKKADVKVVERLLFDTNSAQVIRLDTNEVVRTRPLSLDERQAQLPGVDGTSLTATVGEIAKAKNGAAGKAADACPKELDGVACTRPAGHRGAHGFKDPSPKA